MKTITAILLAILKVLDNLLGWAWSWLYKHGDKDQFED